MNSIRVSHMPVLEELIEVSINSALDDFDCAGDMPVLSPHNISFSLGNGGGDGPVAGPSRPSKWTRSRNFSGESDYKDYKHSDLFETRIIRPMEEPNPAILLDHACKVCNLVHTSTRDCVLFVDYNEDEEITEHFRKNSFIPCNVRGCPKIFANEAFKNLHLKKLHMEWVRKKNMSFVTDLEKEITEEVTSAIAIRAHVHARITTSADQAIEMNPEANGSTALAAILQTKSEAPKEGERNFQCELCQKAYSRIYDLNRHYNGCGHLNEMKKTNLIKPNKKGKGTNTIMNTPRQTRGNLNKTRTAPSVTVGKKKIKRKIVVNFICDLCQRAYASKWTLKRHHTARIHLNNIKKAKLVKAKRTGTGIGIDSIMNTLKQMVTRKTRANAGTDKLIEAKVAKKVSKKISRGRRSQKNEKNLENMSYCHVCSMTFANKQNYTRHCKRKIHTKNYLLYNVRVRLTRIRLKQVAVI